jgi:hypothetical protein
VACGGGDQRIDAGGADGVRRANVAWTAQKASAGISRPTARVSAAATDPIANRQKLPLIFAALAVGCKRWLGAIIRRAVKQAQHPICIITSISESVAS